MYKFSVFLIVCFGVYSSSFSQPAPRNVKFSVGQSVYELPASTKKTDGAIDWHFANRSTTHRLIKKAIDDALKQFGKEKPTLLLIMGRAEDKQLIKSAINAANTNNIPYIFDGSNWNEYTVIGPAGVTHQLQQSFIAIARGDKICMTPGETGGEEMKLNGSVTPE